MNTKSLNEEICTFVINKLKSYKANIIPRDFKSLEDWKKELNNGKLLFMNLLYEITFNPNKSINEYSDAYIDAMRWLTLYMVSLNE